LVVTRIVGVSPCALGIGFGGSIGGNCCANANAPHNKPAPANSFIRRINSESLLYIDRLPLYTNRVRTHAAYFDG
jgi:hypothetical protein